METKTCKICEIEKPLSDFTINRWGTRNGICRECVKSKYRQTRVANRPVIGGGGNLHDPEFDGKEPVEVIQLMSRAKRWLESRGYKIHLEGEFTKVHKIKF